ncbi:MAG: hypothetical protein WC956_07295 [bacterium]
MIAGNYTYASQDGWMTALPSSELAQQQQELSSEGVTSSNFEEAAVSVQEEIPVAEHLGTPVAEAWLLPPFLFLPKICELFNRALNWLIRRSPAEPALVEAPAAKAAEWVHASSPARPLLQQSRTDSHSIREQALLCWKEIETNSLRSMIFRGDDSNDSATCALISGTMVYLLAYENGSVPLAYRDAPCTLFSFQELFDPARPLRILSEQIIEIAQGIDEMADAASKGPAVLVLNEADLLSRDARTIPVSRALMGALAKPGVRKNLLLIATATTPGWKFSDLEAVIRKSGSN